MKGSLPLACFARDAAAMESRLIPSLSDRLSPDACTSKFNFPIESLGNCVVFNYNKITNLLNPKP